MTANNGRHVAIGEHGLFASPEIDPVIGKVRVRHDRRVPCETASVPR